VNRRIVISTLVVLAVGGGLAGHAAAAEQGSRHKICILGPTPQAPNQEGFCITWTDPKLPATR
jgi:hypothetical protein